MIIDEYGITEEVVTTEGPTGVIVGGILRSIESVPSGSSDRPSTLLDAMGRSRRPPTDQND
ncbi:hypothetical protein [Natronorubrum tibetense]|uniref:Uncharacterized protein n=1 Tax=Natronorubrum tibetense GA33 TaxID=1114856 RepID=L9W819_9EURY|nr:hypothetical protein [Natronorubrum tibetense]ELY45477.1 hypothetical protein C496_03613 [Natronorubrum tibetense GA33]